MEMRILVFKWDFGMLNVPMGVLLIYIPIKLLKQERVKLVNFYMFAKQSVSDGSKSGDDTTDMPDESNYSFQASFRLFTWKGILSVMMSLIQELMVHWWALLLRPHTYFVGLPLTGRITDTGPSGGPGGSVAPEH